MRKENNQANQTGPWCSVTLPGMPNTCSCLLFSFPDENHATNFSFISSFQSNLLSEGLQKQIGWGHVWNRFAGPLSCRNQQNQCALTPLLPPGWWDGILQSPIPRDVRRLETYGVKLDGFGSVDENHLRSFCMSRKDTTKTIPVTRKCTGLTCA